MLLLAAVFLGHGLQCGSAAGDTGRPGVHPQASVVLAAGSGHVTPTAAGHGPGVAATAQPAAHHDATPAATAGRAPGHGHGPPGHLWGVCLAVLAAGLAVLVALAADRPLRPVPRAAWPAWLRDLRWPAPPRPPDLFALCVLRT